MKRAIFTTLVVMGLLTGCNILTSSVSSSKTSFELVLASEFINSGLDKRHILKVTPELRKYCGELKKGQYAMWSDSCQFKGSIPDVITLEYALIQGHPSEFHSFGNISTNERIKMATKYAQSLPPSAWRTYTIYPQQLLDKGASMPIWDTRYDKVADDQKVKSRVTVTLYIDGNGKVNQDIKRTLVLSDSVW